MGFEILISLCKTLAIIKSSCWKKAPWKPGSATVFVKLLNSADYFNSASCYWFCMHLPKQLLLAFFQEFFSTVDFEAFLMMVFVSM